MKTAGKARAVLFAVLSLLWVIPIVIALVNSFKTNDAINAGIFSLPGQEGFAGGENYQKALTFGNYPFLKSFGYSVLISTLSTGLIILCCSMAAWYIVRVNSHFSKVFYYMCLFSLAVPFQTFFLIVFPMLRPIAISVGILQLMWIWNDYLLPYLVLDITEYRTIPIHVQYLKGSYGSVDLGASLAVIIMSLIPIMLLYLGCQKYIVKGIAAGAVKG